MEELVIWARWFNFTCYFLSLMILLYKFILSKTLDPGATFDWVRFVLALHLTLGTFSLSEIILTNADWGWRTYGTVCISGLTLWVAIFRVRTCDDSK